jgi:hypothetical protein
MATVGIDVLCSDLWGREDADDVLQARNRQGGNNQYFKKGPGLASPLSPETTAFGIPNTF